MLLWDLTMEMKRGTVFFSDTRIVLKWVKTACMKGENIHQYINTATCDAHVGKIMTMPCTRTTSHTQVTKH